MTYYMAGQIWSLRPLNEKKLEKMQAFIVDFVLFDIIKHLDLTPMKFQRSRSFDDLALRSLVICLST